MTRAASTRSCTATTASPDGPRLAGSIAAQPDACRGRRRTQRAAPASRRVSRRRPRCAAASSASARPRRGRCRRPRLPRQRPQPATRLDAQCTIHRSPSCFAVFVDHVPAAAQAARTARVSCGWSAQGMGREIWPRCLTMSRFKKESLEAGLKESLEAITGARRIWKLA